ncbi:NAD(P)/FAD-dependent oxidoreductase [Pseudomonadota bacterium]
MKIPLRNLSYWHDSIPGSLRPRQYLSADSETEIAIVGAGYTGLWTAYYLKQANPGLDITILEAEIAGFGASGRNGGWCSAYLSGIDQWLNDPAQRESAIRLQRQMFNTVSEIGRVAEQESIDCHFDLSGALEVAVIPPQLERLREEIAHLRELGFGEEDYRWLAPGDIRETLRIDQAVAGIHMRHCAAIHPARLARGLAETLERLGVRIYEKSPVTSIRDSTLTTPGGNMRAGTVIIATEGYSGSIAGRKRRLIPVHSMMVITEPLTDQQIDETGFHRRFCFGNTDRLVTYGHLTPDRRIAFGCRGSYHYGSGIRVFDPDDPEFKLVSATLLRFFPSLQGIRFTHAWGGAMGVSRTLRPSVNFDPQTRFGWAGGFFGNGVGAAHLAGQTMADLVMGHDTERTATPWVNPPDRDRKWEPEPVRWLGIKSRAKLMQLSDQAEYGNSILAPVYRTLLDGLFP